MPCLLLMMPVLRQELGWSVRGSSGWTKETGRWNWRMPNRLWRGRIAAMLIGGLRLKTPLCKNKEEEGSARAWPVAAPMPKSDSS